VTLSRDCGRAANVRRVLEFQVPRLRQGFGGRAGSKFQVVVSLLALFLALAAPPSRAEPARSARAVSLAPSLTELVFALGFGDRLVGRSSACDYPEEARDVPVAGDFGRANWEVLLGLKPDLVMTTDLEKPQLADHMKRAGIRVLILPCEGWDPLMDAARQIGDALGEPEAAAQWVGRMTARRAALERRADEFWRGRRRPRLYAEVWGDPPTTAGSGTFLDDIVTMAGAENIGGDLRGTYIHVSSEWVIAQDPEVILLAYMAPGGPRAASLGRRPGWSSIRAAFPRNVSCGRVRD
jgi:iron complex transport system substrate-binding protein